MSEHLCHAIECKTPVDPGKHMCYPHWRRVPKDLQRALWAAYVPGQEDRKDPSAKYLVAAERCICAVAVKDARLTQLEADTRVIEMQRSAGLISEIFPTLFGPEADT